MPVHESIPADQTIKLLERAGDYRNLFPAPLGENNKSVKYGPLLFIPNGSLRLEARMDKALLIANPGHNDGYACTGINPSAY